MAAFVEVIRNDGSSERLPFEEREVMLGRSANVQLSLPNEPELDLEHVLFVPHGHRGCWVSCAEKVTNPLLLRGQPFEQGIVRWGTEFKVGSLLVRIETGNAKHFRLPKINPRVTFAAIVVAAFVVWSQFQVSHGDMQSGRELTAPALFASLPGCSAAHDPGAAAERAERLAQSRADRYAYDPYDGILAVRHYAEAEACYLASGRSVEAAHAKREKERLHETIDADYAASRTRLLQAFENQHQKVVISEARRLIALTRGVEATENSFVSWLHDVKRRTAARMSHGR